MARAKIFTIAPHAPFLDTLVARIVDGTLPGKDDGVFGLADLTVIVPTRRARLALADAFADQLGGTLMLPDIRTFGGEPAEEEPFLPPFEAELPLPAISALKRRLILAQLVEKWIAAQDTAPFSTPNASGQRLPPNAAEVLALADSLAELIDDCAIGKITPSDVANIPMEGLSANWQRALNFLNIALRAWPEILAENAEIDSSDRRNRLLARQTESLSLIYGERPVIAAGSTGSIAATAELLKAIANLPNGALVLPGLDTSLTPSDHETLLNAQQSPHGHPQYGLARLTRHLGQSHANIVELAETGSARTKLLRHAMALAPDTAHWQQKRAEFDDADIAEALRDIAISVAHTEEEQARAIAIAARQALVAQQTVGIISPDQNLARRIAAELKRFDIEVDDSAGTPLFQSRIGRLLRQIIALVLSDAGAVELVGLLRNRYVLLSRSRAELGQLTDLLELALLRGQRPAPGIDGLMAAIDANLTENNPHLPHRLTVNQGDALRALLSDLKAAFAPAVELAITPVFSASALAAMLGKIHAALCAPAATDTNQPAPGTPILKNWLEDMAALSGHGPQIHLRHMHEALEGLTSGYAVRNPAPAREDIAIWGQLEARLQNPDLLVLAGLNEGIWPEDADPGPWLSRGMRMAVGLEPPERRHGLAAHDFEMAFGNKKLLITLSARAGTGPAIPSRLVQRLEGFAGKEATEALRARGAIWVRTAQKLDDSGPPIPAIRPTPTPPAAIRPKSLRVTEVETLIRSPYDLYAAYVLKLKRLDALGEDPGMRERGTLIHDIFGDFINEKHDVFAPDALDVLKDIAVRKFTILDGMPARQAIWMQRFETAAEGFIAYEKARDSEISERHAERNSRLVLPGADPVTIRGRADRVDRLKDGTLELIDFKTGGIPSASDMKNFMAPQLLVEAAMARTTGFDEIKPDENGENIPAPAIPPTEASRLTYIKIAAGPDAFQETGFKFEKDMDAASATDELVKRLSARVDTFLRQETPMAAQILPNEGQRYRGAYDHLARVAEWTLSDGEDDHE